MTRTGRTLVAILLSLVATVGSAGTGEVQRSYQEAYEVEPGIELRIRHGDGNVVVEAWEENTVSISVDYYGDFRQFPWGEQADFETTFTVVESEIRVLARERNLGILPADFKLSQAYSYEIRIQAPSYLGLNFEGTRGDVTIDGWHGPIELDHKSSDLFLRNLSSDRIKVDTVDSDVTVEGLTGKMRVRAVSADVEVINCNSRRLRVELEDGDVTLKDCEGNFELQTVSGSITAERLRARSLDVRSTDGSVQLDLLKSDKPDLNVTTEDANVSIELEHGTSLGFLVQTFGGRIQMRLPGAEAIEKDQSSVAGRIHGGAGHIRIGTDDGSIRLVEKPKG